METTFGNLANLKVASKRIAHRLLALGENRLELLRLELQEGQEKFLQATALALGLVAAGLLGGIILTFIAVWLWGQDSPVTALIVLTVIYGVTAAVLYMRLSKLSRVWHTPPDRRR